MKASKNLVCSNRPQVFSNSISFLSIIVYCFAFKNLTVSYVYLHFYYYWFVVSLSISHLLCNRFFNSWKILKLVKSKQLIESDSQSLACFQRDEQVIVLLNYRNFRTARSCFDLKRSNYCWVIYWTLRRQVIKFIKPKYEFNTLNFYFGHFTINAAMIILNGFVIYLIGIPIARYPYCVVSFVPLRIRGNRCLRDVT